ncbi:MULTISPECIES: hypothetical protein [Ralstonia solanacearum species complex]|uniref:hypothetical protein n=1 Tax=Ralstonia solanacearum species complex TaxID=3116862 RepID=UPI001E5F6694|nr:hypothetical protein [Ralstonia solanacearum]
MPVQSGHQSPSFCHFRKIEKRSGMYRRIWIAEGYATDGEMYGRALQLPDANTSRSAASPQSIGTDIQRKPAAVVKANVGDIASCPCLDVGLSGIEGESGHGGAACAMD